MQHRHFSKIEINHASHLCLFLSLLVISVPSVILLIVCCMVHHRDARTEAAIIVSPSDASPLRRFSAAALAIFFFGLLFGFLPRCFTSKDDANTHSSHPCQSITPLVRVSSLIVRGRCRQPVGAVRGHSHVSRSQHTSPHRPRLPSSSILRHPTCGSTHDGSLRMLPNRIGNSSRDLRLMRHHREPLAYNVFSMKITGTAGGVPKLSLPKTSAFMTLLPCLPRTWTSMRGKSESSICLQKRTKFWNISPAARSR